ncbi:MAG: fibronectin type III domain-containing protein [Anaeromyxobacter sp.]
MTQGTLAPRPHRWLALAALGCAVACGGGSGGDAPPAPEGLQVAVGDGAVSLAWRASSGATAYEVTVSPEAPGAVVVVAGRSAAVRGLANGTRYLLAVRATNADGASPAAQLEATPTAVDPAAYAPLQVAGDDSPSGVFDPSVLRTSAGELWLAYSGVDYHLDAQSHQVQDVSTRLARSADGGRTFTFARTLAAAGPATVTDTTHQLCGATTCSGRWVHETPWLVEDAADPDPARRFKLFAMKYFLYPPATPATVYALGAVVMWTAPTPGGAWSEEGPLLGWALTPPELAAPVDVNGLDPALGDCVVLAEGGAWVRDGALDLVLSCPVPGADPLPQKIVLLRSRDHARTFSYVSTLLEPEDAAAYGASFFTAPSLPPAADQAPVLLVTPTLSGFYAGCLALPFADPVAGTLVRAGGVPVPILGAPVPAAGHFGGACAWEGGLGAPGILIDDVVLGGPWPPQFRILATGHGL